MAQGLNIPTRLRFWRVPVEWTMLSEGSELTSAVLTRFTGKITQKVESMAEVGREIDGDQVWDEFFRLPEGDDAGVFKLLNKVGLWESDPPGAFISHRADEYIPIAVGGRFVSSYIRAVDSTEIWRFRRKLRATLPNRKRFIEKFAGARLRNRLGRISYTTNSSFVLNWIRKRLLLC